MTKPARSLEFDSAGFEDLAWWIEKDRKKALRIVKLIKEVQRTPRANALGLQLSQYIRQNKRI